MGKSFKCSLAFVAIVYHILLQRNPHVLRGILIFFIGKTHTPNRFWTHNLTLPLELVMRRVASWAKAHWLKSNIITEEIILQQIRGEILKLELSLAWVKKSLINRKIWCNWGTSLSVFKDHKSSIVLYLTFRSLV